MCKMESVRRNVDRLSPYVIACSNKCSLKHVHFATHALCNPCTLQPMHFATCARCNMGTLPNFDGFHILFSAFEIFPYSRDFLNYFGFIALCSMCTFLIIMCIVQYAKSLHTNQLDRSARWVS